MSETGRRISPNCRFLHYLGVLDTKDNADLAARPSLEGVGEMPQRRTAISPEAVVLYRRGLELKD